jgi:hypothetical protein
MSRDKSKPHAFWSPRKGMWISQCLIQGVWFFAVSLGGPVRAIHRAYDCNWTDTSDQEPRVTLGARK